MTSGQFFRLLPLERIAQPDRISLLPLALWRALPSPLLRRAFYPHGCLTPVDKQTIAFALALVAYAAVAQS